MATAEFSKFINIYYVAGIISPNSQAIMNSNLIIFTHITFVFKASLAS